MIATFHKGDSLAEAAAFLGKPYPASGQAMTPLRVLSIDGEMLMQIMQNNRDVLAQSLASVYHELHELVDSVEWFKSRTNRERLAKFLLDQMNDNDDRCEVRLPFNKSDIAAKVGTSPQQLSRTFNGLREFGVEVSGEIAIIESRQALQKMIDKY